MRTIRCAALAVAGGLLFAGCGGESAKQPPQEPSAADEQPTVEETPDPEPTNDDGPVLLELGEPHELANGYTVTAFEHRAVTDMADNNVGAIDVEVCIDNTFTSPEEWHSSFWTVIDTDRRQYQDASMTWRHDEISPGLGGSTNIPPGSCTRGWEIMDSSSETDVEYINFYDFMSETTMVFWEVE